MIQTEYKTIDSSRANRAGIDYVHTENSIKLTKSQVLTKNFFTENNSFQSESKDVFTVIELFSNRQEAKNAVMEMQRQGLESSQVIMITKNYQEHEESMHWEYISTDGGLLVVLEGLGINDLEASHFVNAVKDGKFLVVAIITDRSAYQAQYLLENIGRKVVAVY
ncbi:hypothetical protein HCU40_17640 [Pseudanabaena biceps]|nr:hypothetical protein [Pseudanabaena biceps]